MIERREGEIHPRFGHTMSLGCSHVERESLELVFVYQELVHDGDKWVVEVRRTALVLNEHFRLDKAKGVIELLDHSLWHTIGLWRAADTKEELLYKGQVKHPQFVEFSCMHLVPEDRTAEMLKQPNWNWEE